MKRTLLFIGLILFVTGLFAGIAAALLLPASASAQDLPGEGRRLDLVGVDVTQDEIASGSVSLDEIRRQGQLVFSAPFNKADGYGDGPGVAPDPTPPGGRPTLQDNGTFLRVNGLDGQSCASSVTPLSAIGAFPRRSAWAASAAPRATRCSCRSTSTHRTASSTAASSTLPSCSARVASSCSRGR